MRPAVNGAGAGAALGRYIPDNGKRRGRGFPDDGEHTFAAGGEYQLQPFIESHAVTPIADRQFGDHGAIGGIHDDQLLVATGEKPFGFQIDGETGRAFGSQWPAGDDRLFTHIHFRYLVLVFDVHIDQAFPVGHSRFRFAVERDRVGHSARGTIYNRKTPASSIAGYDSLREGLIHNGIRVLTCSYLTLYRACLDIEDRDIVQPPVARIAFPRPLVKGDAMDAGGIGNYSYRVAGFFVQDIDLRPMRDIDLLIRSHGYIIPAAGTTDLKRFGNGETAAALCIPGGSGQAEGQ